MLKLLVHFKKTVFSNSNLAKSRIQNVDKNGANNQNFKFHLPFSWFSTTLNYPVVMGSGWFLVLWVLVAELSEI